MAYVRWSEDSSVYVFLHVNGYITCCGCLLQENNTGTSYTARDPEFYSRSAAIKHLLRHVEAGHRVPARAFERLEAEILETSDTSELGRQKCRKVLTKRRRISRRGKPLSIARKNRVKVFHKMMKNIKRSQWKKITDYSGD